MKKLMIMLISIMLSATLFLLSCEKQADKKMVMLPVEDDPTISIRLWFKVGSQDDPEGKEGLAALTAELMTNGATQERSYEEILEKLYPMAADIDNQVDKEMTIISGRIHKDNLHAYYQLFKEVVLSPGFKEEDFRRIKSNTTNYLENRLRYANDEELGKEVLSEFVFEETPYQHIEEGHISSLKKVTLLDVKDFYQKYYTWDNLVIGLGGGYSPEFEAQIKEDLQNLATGKPELPEPPQPNSIEGLKVKIVEKSGANATAISFGYPIDILRGEDDFYALALANSWLGEHRNSSSHLYQVIREARGLNYGDYSYIEHFPHGYRRQFPPPNVGRRQQLFQIWIRPVPNEARLFSFRAALRELEQLVENGLTQDQFELTRTFLKNYILHYAPTTMMKLGYALDDEFYGIDRHYVELFRHKMDELTLNDVNDAIREHLQYKNIKVVFVTNNAEELKEQMVNNEPSPIEYENPKPETVLEEDKKIANYPLNIKSEDVIIEPVDKVFE